MISFQSLEISNFKSIEHAVLHYKKGVWHVVGENNDSAFSSNGSGKTSTMEAIQQCLFNKTTSPAPIDDTSRKTEGAVNHIRKYKLELTFTCNGSLYKIINDRKLMHIRIYKDHKDLMIKSIPNSLKYIQEVLGMDFQTFVTLTFINHDTIIELLDNFSSSSLMKIILNFSQIMAFEKTAKVEQKVVNQEIIGLQNQIQTLSDSLLVLTSHVELDLHPLVVNKLAVMKELDDFIKVALPKVEIVESLVQNRLAAIKETTKDLTNKRDFFSSSKCKCCGTLLHTTDEQRNITREEIRTLERLLVKHEEVLGEEKTTASSERETYITEHLALTNKVMDADNRLLVAKTRNQLYTESREQADVLRARKAQLEVELQEAQVHSDVLQAALSVIKAGDIQKDLLETFVAVLNVHLLKFMKFVSLNYISILAESTKSSVSFKIYDTRFSQHISIHTLSGGEKTRLRLVVLLAMLYTIKDLADVSTNLLIFDESLDTLDASATKDLANLFSYLVNNDNKFIAMVSHGAQLSEVDFTGTITATKANGATTLTQEDL